MFLHCQTSSACFQQLFCFRAGSSGYFWHLFMVWCNERSHTPDFPYAVLLGEVGIVSTVQRIGRHHMANRSLAVAAAAGGGGSGKLSMVECAVCSGLLGQRLKIGSALGGVPPYNQLWLQYNYPCRCVLTCMFRWSLMITYR